jgi:alcohol dehydrogenase (cytochrome c)
MVSPMALAMNYVRSINAPPGTLTLEAAPAASGVPLAAASSSTVEASPEKASHEWSSYNRELASQRYSPLSQIDHDNVGTLKVLCTYDTKQYSSFEAGLIMVNGALIGTTERDIFSIDPATCAENWRTRDRSDDLRASRGAAYLDGLLFRGHGDGRVAAYDFKTGARVWETSIANRRLGESVGAAPIAWNGLVFIGNAGGDEKGVKGRMYALEAKTGRIVWEFYLVPKGPNDPTRGPQGATPLDSSTWGNEPDTPITGGATWSSYSLDPERGELYIPTGNAAPNFAKGPRKGTNLYSGSVVVLDAKTGAYVRHYEITSGDWHDWDVSNAPALIRTRAGKRLMAVAPKDGHLYGFDLDSNALIYRRPVDRIQNADMPFSTEVAVHFCPGTGGGAEFNGPSYHPGTNMILVGEVDRCSSIRLQSNAEIHAVKLGAGWTAMATHNPFDIFGVSDPYREAGGWIYASDADTGEWRWRARSNYPILSGITTTAGGLVFFGDMGGNFYALDIASGQRRLSMNLGGAIAGGVITYAVAGAQKVAVAAGFTAVLWPTRVVTGKVVILGLPPP